MNPAGLFLYGKNWEGGICVWILAKMDIFLVGAITECSGGYCVEDTAHGVIVLEDICCTVSSRQEEDDRSFAEFGEASGSAICGLGPLQPSEGQCMHAI